ncbi:MAG: hypothetical protein ACREFY_13775, partial [Acetobacteraceae bacterium]
MSGDLKLRLTRFGGALQAFERSFTMAMTRPPYSPEFSRQMVDLVRAGRDPAALAREFEPSSFAMRLSACPPTGSADDAQALRNAGLSDGEILDLLLAVAMFGWANRLIHPLG